MPVPPCLCFSIRPGRLQVLNPVVAPGEEWWLDAEAARGVPVGVAAEGVPEGALTFTLRANTPIHLTRDQVGCCAQAWKEIDSMQLCLPAARDLGFCRPSACEPARVPPSCRCQT